MHGHTNVHKSAKLLYCINLGAPHQFSTKARRLLLFSVTTVITFHLINVNFKSILSSSSRF